MHLFMWRYFNHQVSFRLKDDPSNCGHSDPGFVLDCENNHTIFYRKYYVTQINYHNYTVRIVTPRFLSRPDWRIRTEFGVRDSGLGLLTCFFFLKPTGTCGYGPHTYNNSKYYIQVKRTTTGVVSIKIYTHINESHLHIQN